MSEELLKEIKEMDRSELEKLIVRIWDDLREYKNHEFDGLFLNDKPKPAEYINQLEVENGILIKDLTKIYDDIKLKTLRYLLDAKPDNKQIEIFSNIFKKYL